jgi:hypothetical protein
MRNGIRAMERLPPFAAYTVFAAGGTVARDGADTASEVSLLLAECNNWLLFD